MVGNVVVVVFEEVLPVEDPVADVVDLVVVGIVGLEGFVVGLGGLVGKVVGLVGIVGTVVGLVGLVGKVVGLVGLVGTVVGLVGVVGTVVGLVGLVGKVVGLVELVGIVVGLDAVVVLLSLVYVGEGDYKKSSKLNFRAQKCGKNGRKCRNLMESINELVFPMPPKDWSTLIFILYVRSFSKLMVSVK